MSDLEETKQAVAAILERLSKRDYHTPEELDAAMDRSLETFWVDEENGTGRVCRVPQKFVVELALEWAVQCDCSRAAIAEIGAILIREVEEATHIRQGEKGETPS